MENDAESRMGDIDFSQPEDAIQKLRDEVRRSLALAAAAEAFPGGVFHSVFETDRGVLELARSFEKYLKSG